MSLGYSTLIIVCVIFFNRVQRLKTSWQIYAMTSIPGDLLMVSVAVAMVAVLSIQYFECSVLARTDSRASIPHFCNDFFANRLKKASRTS